MDTLYVPQIVKVKVNLDPSEIDGNFEEKLKRKIKDKYGDSCYYNGFIRKSSIELTKIEPGRRLGSHLHGSLTFKVEFQAQFCVPKKDKLIRCRIKTVNKFGALAEFYPMEIIIPKQIHHDNIEVFSNLKEGDYVYIRTLNYDIKEDKLIVVGIITGLAIDKQTHLVLPSDAYIGDYKAEIVLSNSPPEPNKLLGSAETLNEIKAKITPHASKIVGKDKKVPGVWDTLIKYMINPYELIETYSEDKPGKFQKYAKSVIKYDAKGINGVYPIFSRAYFKLWEVLKEKDLNIMSGWKGKPIHIASLAEGPGGFIQAMIDFRNQQNEGAWKKDTYSAITLKSGTKGDGTLDWSYPKSKTYSDHLIKSGYKIGLSYGETGTGDLTKLENIRHFATTDLQGEKCELVTADGGIELSSDEEYSSQEIMNAKLFFSEILAALSVQKLEGTFIIKIYDIFYDITMQLITLLSGYYEQLTIIKPRTSRPANSEKYIVCQKFKGITDDQLTELYDLHKKWLEIESAPSYFNNDKYVTSLFTFFGTNDSAYLKNLVEFNDSTITMTIEKITEGLCLIANGDTAKKEVLDTFKANQRALAIKWCQEFNMAFIPEA
jgi:DNA-directed RNA polymerase subunit E'/Rpb7/23S rRNA U2552 (ribose-2'-O)-methylase RlmE/FtsJ